MSKHVTEIDRPLWLSVNGLRVTITITTAIQNYRIWSFRGISLNSVKFRGNGQIPRLGSKFRGPRKTVVPNDHNMSCDRYVLRLRSHNSK